MTKSLFTYCPLVWIFCSRTSNILINKTHECFFRLILNEHEISFIYHLREDNCIRNHQRNTKILLPEIFKTTKNAVLPIMEGLIISRPNNHNLRNFQELVTEKKRTVKKWTRDCKLSWATITVTFT